MEAEWERAAEIGGNGDRGDALDEAASRRRARVGARGRAVGEGRRPGRRRRGWRSQCYRWCHLDARPLGSTHLGRYSGW